MANGIVRFSIRDCSSSTPALASVSRDSDVVKRGCLYVKRPPSDRTFKLRLRTWQKRYLVLRDSWSDDGVSCLELYVCIDSSKCHAVSLRDVMFVDVYRDSKSFPHAFIVFRANKSPLIFAAKTDREMRQWMMAIKLLAEKLTAAGGGVDDVARQRTPQQCQQHLLHASRRDDVTRRSSPQLPCISSSRWSIAESYPVSVEAHNDPGMRFSPHEDYALTVSDNCVTLRPTYATSGVQDVDVMVRWQLADIRKLKCESVSNDMADLVTLVAIRAGSRDPVTYTFRTQFGLAIIHCVKQVEVQSQATEQPYTPPTVSRSTRRPSANYIPTSCSFDSAAADAVKGSGSSCSRSQPDLLSATSSDDIESTVTSTNIVTTRASTRHQRTVNSHSTNDQEAAFYLKLMSDETSSNSRHLTRPTSKSLDDITDDSEHGKPPPRPPRRPLHTMSNV